MPADHARRGAYRARAGEIIQASAASRPRLRFLALWMAAGSADLPNRALQGVLCGFPREEVQVFDPYEALGVPRTASAEQLAYRLDRQYCHGDYRAGRV